MSGPNKNEPNKNSTADPSAESSSQITLFRRELFAAAILLVLVCTGVLGWLALQKFERDLAPEIIGKSEAVGQSIAAQVERAVGYGIPFEALRGMDPFLATALSGHPEITYVVLTDVEGRPLFQHGPHAATAARALAEHGPARGREGATTVPGLEDFLNTAMPLESGGEVLGTMHLGIPASFVRDTFIDIGYDLLIVLLASFLIAFEVLVFAISRTVAGPFGAVLQVMARATQGRFDRIAGLRGSDELARFARARVDAVVLDLNRRYQALAGAAVTAGRDAAKTVAALRERFSFAADESGPRPLRANALSDIRLPMFLFVFAEELSRAFFPLYVQELYAPVPGLSQEAVIGLPIAVYMFFVAAATPFAGIAADRIGSRRLFYWGAGVSLLGFLGTAMALSLYDLLAWRALTAVGYAVATIACQAYIVEHTTTENRTQGMAIFVGIIMAAAICGTSIGGVIAERIGYAPTFLVSTLLVGLSAAILLTALEPEEHKGETSMGVKIGWADMRLLFTNVHFAALMLFAAIPAKIILTGFLFYLTPLYLSALGAGPSAIGRAMMIYFIIMVGGNYLCAWLADRLGMRLPLVVAGGVIAGAGALGILWFEDMTTILLAIGALGLGHSLSTTPLVASVPDICARECERIGRATVLGVVRVVERVGSVLGPFIAAALINFAGFAGSMAGIGYLVLVSALLLALLLLRVRARDTMPSAR